MDNSPKASSSQEDKFMYTQCDENHKAQVVVLNEPALANWMGSCHPNGSLYENPLDLKLAQKEHQNFRKELEKNGCKVMTVREILMKDVDTDTVARMKLEQLAFKSLTFRFVGNDSDLTDKEKYLISDDYKREVIENMDGSQLVEVVLTRPTIHLTKADKDTELAAVNYSYSPLSNLVFCRDQQITTAKGVVMGRLRNSIRAPEVNIMEFCFEKLNVPIIGRVKAPGTLEGGDFFPAGKDLCLVGVGLRSNIAAVKQLMEQDLFGTRRVAVVKDYFDQSQQRMHLDTIFNIIAHKVCILLGNTQGVDSPRRRLVDVYTKGPDGAYHLEHHDVEFSAFLRNEGYHIIELTEEMQYAYGCNGLNLGNNTLLTVDKTTAKHIAANNFTGRIIVIDFKNITNMYGSVHCCSQVISRHDPSSVAASEKIDMAYKLCKAAASNNVTQIQNYLVGGADVNASDYHTRTALHVAACEGHLETVKYLCENGALVNQQDAWGRTPVDDAEFFNRKEVVEYLRSVGALSSKELKEKQKPATAQEDDAPKKNVPSSNTPAIRRNSTRSLIMVAPTNFAVDMHSATDNVFMSEAKNTMDRMIKELPEGKRGVYQQLLDQFQHLHKIITVDIGAEVFLFTHHAYERIPDAMFVRDWFSTHSSSESAVPTLCLYSMRAPSRRLEKRDELVSFLMQRYKRILNLSPCENGELKALDSVELGAIKYTDEGPYPAPETAAALPLESSSFVADRIEGIAYYAWPSSRISEEVLQLWANEMKYKLYKFHIDVSLLQGRKLHHTRAIMSIGTKFAMVCTEIVKKEDREALLESLSSNGSKVVIELTWEQTLNFAAYSAQELLDRDGNPVLILSESAMKSLTEQQLGALSQAVAKIYSVDISLIEKLGGGSVSGIVGELF